MGLGGAGMACVTVAILRGLLVAMPLGSPLIFSGGVREPATMWAGSATNKSTPKVSHQQLAIVSSDVI